MWVDRRFNAIHVHPVRYREVILVMTRLRPWFWYRRGYLMKGYH